MTDRAKSATVFTLTGVWVILFTWSLVGGAGSFPAVEGIMIAMVGGLLAIPTTRPPSPEQRMAKRLEKKGHPVLLVHKECECCKKNGYSPRHHRRLAALANASDHRPTIPEFVLPPLHGGYRPSRYSSPRRPLTAPPKPPKGEGAGSHGRRAIDDVFIRDLKPDRPRNRQDVNVDSPPVVEPGYETYEPPESPKTEPRLVQTWDQYGKRRA